MPKLDTSILSAALLGYQHHLAELHARIAEIQAELKGRSRRGTAPVTGTRRKMSATGRRRIAEAQRKRWAAYKKHNKVS